MEYNSLAVAPRRRRRRHVVVVVGPSVDDIGGRCRHRLLWCRSSEQDSSEEETTDRANTPKITAATVPWYAHAASELVTTAVVEVIFPQETRTLLCCLSSMFLIFLERVTLSP